MLRGNSVTRDILIPLKPACDSSSRSFVLFYGERLNCDLNFESKTSLYSCTIHMPCIKWTPTCSVAQAWRHDVVYQVNSDVQCRWSVMSRRRVSGQLWSAVSLKRDVTTSCFRPTALQLGTWRAGTTQLWRVRLRNGLPLHDLRGRHWTLRFQETCSFQWRHALHSPIRRSSGYVG